MLTNSKVLSTPKILLSCVRKTESVILIRMIDSAESGYFFAFHCGVILHIKHRIWPPQKTQKNNHSVIVVVIIETEVKKNNKTVLFFFNTYTILWLNPYYEIHGEISIKLSSLKYVSFVSIVCLFSWLVCVTWCDYDVFL